MESMDVDMEVAEQAVAPQQGTEKREFLRLEMDIPVMLVEHTTEERIAAVCRDLSGTGLLVEMSLRPALGTTYDVSIPVSRPELQIGSLEAIAEVTRVTPRGERHEIGLKICSIKA